MVACHIDLHGQANLINNLNLTKSYNQQTNRMSKIPKLGQKKTYRYTKKKSYMVIQRTKWMQKKNSY